MSDEDSTSAQSEWPGDRSVERRQDRSRSSDSQSSRELRKRLGSDREISSRGDRQLQDHDDELTNPETVEIDRLQRSGQISVTRIAPLPTPAELKGYDDISPGLANRIVRMAEESSDAAASATRSDAEVNNAIADSIRSEAASLKRGQWIFAALTILFLIASVFLEVLDRTPFATGIGVLGFLSLVGIILRPVSAPRWLSNKDGDSQNSS